MNQTINNIRKIKYQLDIEDQTLTDEINNTTEYISRSKQRLDDIKPQLKFSQQYYEELVEYLQDEVEFAKKSFTNKMGLIWMIMVTIFIGTILVLIYNFDMFSDMFMIIATVLCIFGACLISGNSSEDKNIIIRETEERIRSYKTLIDLYPTLIKERDELFYQIPQSDMELKELMDKRTAIKNEIQYHANTIQKYKSHLHSIAVRQQKRFKARMIKLREKKERERKIQEFKDLYTNAFPSVLPELDKAYELWNISKEKKID